MPGAYEKKLSGENFEALVAAVERCRECLASGDFDELMSAELPILLVMQKGRSKKDIEAFCYAGGFDVMLGILKERAENEAVGDVELIIRNFSALLAVEVDPCERWRTQQPSHK